MLKEGATKILKDMPQNLLLDAHHNIKLCDFGWSAQQITTKRTTFCGTYEYMAPQMLFNSQYDYRVDIWALGILLYELLHGQAPFKGKTIEEVQASMLEGKYKIDDKLSDGVKHLIQLVLQFQPEERASIEQIKSHKWMKRMETSLTNSMVESKLSDPMGITYWLNKVELPDEPAEPLSDLRAPARKATDVGRNRHLATSPHLQQSATTANSAGSKMNVSRKKNGSLNEIPNFFQSQTPLSPEGKNINSEHQRQINISLSINNFGATAANATGQTTTAAHPQGSLTSSINAPPSQSNAASTQQNYPSTPSYSKNKKRTRNIHSSEDSQLNGNQGSSREPGVGLFQFQSQQQIRDDEGRKAKVAVTPLSPKAHWLYKNQQSNQISHPSSSIGQTNPSNGASNQIGNNLKESNIHSNNNNYAYGKKNRKYIGDQRCKTQNDEADRMFEVQPQTLLFPHPPSTATTTQKQSTINTNIRCGSSMPEYSQKQDGVDKFNQTALAIKRKKTANGNIAANPSAPSQKLNLKYRRSQQQVPTSMRRVNTDINEKWESVPTIEEACNNANGTNNSNNNNNNNIVSPIQNNHKNVPSWLKNMQHPNGSTQLQPSSALGRSQGINNNSSNQQLMSAASSNDQQQPTHTRPYSNHPLLSGQQYGSVGLAHHQAGTNNNSNSHQGVINGSNNFSHQFSQSGQSTQNPVLMNLTSPTNHNHHYSSVSQLASVGATVAKGHTTQVKSGKNTQKSKIAMKPNIQTPPATPHNPFKFLEDSHSNPQFQEAMRSMDTMYDNMINIGDAVSLGNQDASIPSDYNPVYHSPFNNVDVQQGLQSIDQCIGQIFGQGGDKSVGKPNAPPQPEYVLVDTKLATNFIKRPEQRTTVANRNYAYLHEDQSQLEQLQDDQSEIVTGIPISQLNQPVIVIDGKTQGIVDGVVVGGQRPMHSVGQGFNQLHNQPSNSNPYNQNRGPMITPNYQPIQLQQQYSQSSASQHWHPLAPLRVPPHLGQSPQTGQPNSLNNQLGNNMPYNGPNPY